MAPPRPAAPGPALPAPAVPAPAVPAVVLDLSANGIAIARGLATRGIPITAVDRAPRVRAGRTRYARCLACPDPAQDPAAATDFLLHLATTLSHGRPGGYSAETVRPVLIPASDDFVHLVSDRRDRLAASYRFLLPAPALTDALLDKAGTHRLAQEHGFPTPGTWLLPPAGHPAAGELEQVRFPCVVKPARSHRFRRRLGVKALLAGNPRELESFRRRAAGLGPLLVQEFIPGGDDRVYQVGFVLDEAGRMLGRFMGRKLLQFPPRFGSGALVESVVDPAVLELGTRVVSTLGLRGACNVEFKRDPRDGRLKLIEIDPRLWLWHDLSRAAGADLAHLYYRLMTGDRPNRPLLHQTEGLKWVYEARALMAAWQTWRQGERSLRRLVEDFGGPKVWALFRWDDPSPFLRLSGSSLVQALGRTRREG